MYLYNLIQLLQKDQKNRQAILSSYLSPKDREKAENAINKFEREIQTEFLGDLFSDYKDNREDKKVIEFFNKEMKEIYKNNTRFANDYITSINNKGGLKYLETLFLDMKFEDISKEDLKFLFKGMTVSRDNPNISFKKYLKSLDEDERKKTKKAFSNAFAQNKIGFTNVWKLFKGENLAFSSSGEPINESKQDNISNLLENLVNNYINQRKQQWQKRTT